jgi:hypothetical protein
MRLAVREQDATWTWPKAMPYGVLGACVVLRGVFVPSPSGRPVGVWHF